MLTHHCLTRHEYLKNLSEQSTRWHSPPRLGAVDIGMCQMCHTNVPLRRVLWLPNELTDSSTRGLISQSPACCTAFSIHPKVVFSIHSPRHPRFLHGFLRRAWPNAPRE